MKLKKKFWFIILVICTAVILALVGGCTRQTQEIPQQQEQHQPQERREVDRHLAALHLDKLEQQPGEGGGTPASLSCFLNDRTISMKRASSARPLTMKDMMLLIEHTDTYGGSIALGHISETTGPLKTLWLPPPERDELPPASNVFTRNKQLREYEAEKPAREAREAKRRESNQLLIKDFVQQDLGAYLAAPQNGHITNLWNGLKRCEIHLLENAEYWARTTGTRPKVSIVVRTDGLHDAEEEFKPLDPSITVLAITGGTDIGDLDQLDPPPRLFESPTSSILFITSNGGK